MDQTAYDQLTQELLDRAAGHAEVLGLVALGSMAAQDYQPDAYSDHDFFLVAREAAAESLRADLSWLPRPDSVALAFRETEHGSKVLYDDGHLLEFAVFTLDELMLARVNRYRVLLDRADVAGRLASVQADTSQWVQAAAPSDMLLVGQLLTALQVGVGRWARGEHLIGRAMVQAHAVRHLLVLLARHVPAHGATLLDGLEPTRRFEQVYPGLGAELDEALAAPPPQSAAALLALARRELSGRVPDLPEAAFDVVGRYIEAAQSPAGGLGG